MSDTFSVNNGYIQLPVTTDPNTLIQQAIAAIQAELPGWVPTEGAIEMILLEQFGAMAAAAANVASTMPIAAFEFFGQLVGINPISGSPASALSTWTMIDTQGYTVPAGTVVGYQLLGNQIALFSTTEPFSTTAASPGRTIAAAQLTGSSPIILDPANSFTQSDLNKSVTDGGVSIPRAAVANGSTTVASGSNGQTLPQSTIDVAASTSFSTAGSGWINTSLGYQIISWTGKGSGTLTGCTGGTGVINTGNNVYQMTALPSSVINVDSTTGFASSGSMVLYSNVGTPAAPISQAQFITYTGVTSTSFTGCTGGAGFIWNGYHVHPYILSVQTTGEATMSVNASTNEASEAVTLGSIAGSAIAIDVPIQSQVSGSINNNLPTGPLTLVAPSWSFVSSVAATTVSSGGTDAETVDSYINRLSQELQLLTPRPIVPNDFAVLAQGIPGVARAVAYNNTYSGASFNANLASGSPTVTAAPATTVASGSNGAILPQSIIDVVSTTNFPSTGSVLIQTSDGFFPVTYTGITSGSLTGCVGGAGSLSTGGVVSGSTFFFEPFLVGLGITGTAIPTSTHISAYVNPVQLTMSANATTNETYETATIPYDVDIERAVAVTAIDSNGQPVAQSVANEIIAKLEALREINFMVSYIPATYQDLYVTYVVIADPNANPAAVSAAVDAAVTSYLSPANWAGGNQDPPIWDVTLDTVYYLSLASVIESVPGVQSIQVVTGTPSLGLGTSVNPSYGYNDVSLVSLPGNNLPNLVSVSGTALLGS